MIRRLTFRGREGGEEPWGAPLIGTSTGWTGNALGLAGSLTAVYQIMQAILKSRNRKMCCSTSVYSVQHTTIKIRKYTRMSTM